MNPFLRQSNEIAKHPTLIIEIKVSIELPNVACDDEGTKKAIAQVAEHYPVLETICSMENIVLNIHFGKI